jgi:dipeptidyl aminopeptidase/acylaminoacyl peptidase
VTVLRDANGARVVELERGTTDGLRATGWTPAEVVRVKARDGVTDLWGIMHKPSDFDPSRRYPIVAVIYPGPQMGSVGDWVFKGPDASRGLREILPSGPEQIRIYSGDGMRRSLAELGFIVVELDAMGTAKRSKAFESFYFGNARDNGLPDQIAAIRQLADRHPWIDTSRVGVWGHSGGGYSAAAAMFHHPDVFKVGVSQSGNHDFRIYGWYWGEKYQGPYERVGDSDNYEEEANYKYAAQLRGKLLIVTGDMDCNNPPAETLRVVDALMRAEKDFDMLVVPDHGHQMPPYVIRRAWDYFVEHLQGTTPPRGYRMIQ